MSANHPSPDSVRTDLRQITSETPAVGAPPQETVTSERPGVAQLPETPRPPHPGFWWALLWCIGFVIVTQFPGALVAIAIIVVYSLIHPQAVGNASALLQSPVMSVALGAAFFVTEILVIGVSLLVIRLVVGRDWTRQLAVRRPSVAHLGLAVASLPGLVVLANAAYVVLKRILPDPSKLLGTPDMMTQVMALFDTWPWPFAVLVIGLGPGIGEELWCRGFLGRGLVGKYGPTIGVVLSSFFFGLIHLDPAQGTMAMLMGLYLHFTYLATRSLWVPMLLHFLNNSFAVISSRISVLQTLDADPAKTPAYFFLAAAALVAIVVWALYTSRARLVPQGGAALWQPTVPGVEYPPEGSELTVVHPRPSLAALGFTLLALGGFIVSCYLVM